MAEIIVLSLLALVFGFLLGFAAVKYKTDGDPMVDKINSILPQTQCGQCDFPGCKPYAEAMAKGEAEINRCPPGGESTIVTLSDLLGVEVKPLEVEEKKPSVVIIREDECIGCTLCIQACPVDAIMGAAKQMHTIITDECTGCDLCIPPCPVDCIDIVIKEATLASWVPERPQSKRLGGTKK